MTSSRIVRVLATLIPSRWRTSVLRDLNEEAERYPAGWRRQWWIVRQLCAITLRLHSHATIQVSSESRGTLTGFSRDVVAGTRHLRRATGSTFIAISTLSLAVAAVVTVTAILYRSVLSPLPFADADRLIGIWRMDPAAPQNWLAATPGDFVDWDREARSFETLAAARNVSLAYTALEGGGAPLMRRVTHDWFEALGVTPALGREFTPDDDRPHGPRAAVLSHATWQRRFAGRPNIVGDLVELDGATHTIIGVLPASYSNPLFGTPDQAEIYLPLQLAASGESRALNNLTVVGRLRDGVTLDQARAEIDALSERQAQAFPETNRQFRGTTQQLDEQLVRPVRTPLTLLFVSVLGLFIAACGNVANLNLVRALGRRHEHAVQQALGASRWRLLLQALVESNLVALIAGATAVGLVAVAGPAAKRLTPPGFLAPTVSFEFDVSILIITGLVTLIATFVTAVPAMIVTSRRLDGACLAAGTVRAVGSRERRRWAGGLVAVELAVATVLLAGAGLAASGFRDLHNAPLGFDPASAISFRVSTRGPEFADSEARYQFFERVLEELRAVPGVQAVGGMNALPVFGQFGERAVYRADVPDVPAPGTEPRLTVIPVTDGFFSAMGIRRLDGRDIGPGDQMDAPFVAVLSQSAARRVFGEGAVIGRPMAVITGTRTTRVEIVGVVEDVRSSGDPTTVTAVAYVPLRQSPAPNAFGFVVRSQEPPAVITRQSEAAVHRINRSMPLYLARPMSDVADALRAMSRLIATLMVVFAGLALALVASGLYGTIAHLVHDRRKELGVRLALGASRTGVLALVLRDGLRPALVGIGAGLVGAVAAGRIMAGLVVGTPAFLWPVFLALPIALLGICVMSSLIPALEATSVDPTTALRTD